MSVLLEGVDHGSVPDEEATLLERPWRRNHSVISDSFEQLVPVGDRGVASERADSFTLGAASPVTSEGGAKAVQDRFVRVERKAPAVDLRTRFVALQEWEGKVRSVDAENGVFEADLVDLTAGVSVEGDEATFPLGDVQDYERSLVVEGAFFRWVVGYRYIGRTRERTSRVVFRRLPAWSTSDLMKASEEAESLATTLRGI